MEAYRIDGIFRPKEVLFEENRISQKVLWNFDGTCIELHDRKALEALRTQLYRAHRWDYVKLVNQILLELDAYEKRITVTSYPVNLQIEHTNLCNAECIMCSHCFTRNHGGKHMSDRNLDALEKIFPYAEHVTLHGMGEPFLYSRILEVLEKYYNYGIKVTCNTNASVMTDELAEMIHKCFYDISVSCDACTKETYEKIRGGLRFDNFLRNVRLLRSKGTSLFMRLSTVAMRQNLTELPGIVKLAAELGFQEVLIVDVTTQKLLNNEKDCLPLYPAAAKHYLQLAVEQGERCGIPVKIPDYIMQIPSDGHTYEADMEMIRRLPLYPEKKFMDHLYQRYAASGFIEPTIQATKDNFIIPSEYTCKGICDFVLERPFINANGDVFLCCTNWMHIIGNIYRDGGFQAVWNGDIIRQIREMFYAGSVPKYCVGCIFLRNQMMCKRIVVENMSEAFYQHNYDEQISELIKGF